MFVILLNAMLFNVNIKQLPLYRRKTERQTDRQVDKQTDKQPQSQNNRKTEANPKTD